MSPAEFVDKPYQMLAPVRDYARRLTPRQFAELIYTTFYFCIYELAAKQNITNEEAFDILFTYIAKFVRDNRNITKSKRVLFYETFRN